MRHYEIVVLVHPDQSAQVEGMIGRYQSMIEKGGGTVHRKEDWGRRQLAYTINKVRKAHYFLLNIECDQKVLDELNTGFRYNDAIIRNLVLTNSQAPQGPSPFMKEVERKTRHKMERAQRSAAKQKTAEPAISEGQAADSADQSTSSSAE